MRFQAPRTSWQQTKSMGVSEVEGFTGLVVLNHQPIWKIYAHVKIGWFFPPIFGMKIFLFAISSLETSLKKETRNPESPRVLFLHLAIFRVDFIHGKGWCLWWTPSEVESLEVLKQLGVGDLGEDMNFLLKHGHFPASHSLVCFGSLHLKIDGWNTIVSLGMAYFQGQTAC